MKVMYYCPCCGFIDMLASDDPKDAKCNHCNCALTKGDRPSSFVNTCECGSRWDCIESPQID